MNPTKPPWMCSEYPDNSIKEEPRGDESIEDGLAEITVKGEYSSCDSEELHEKKEMDIGPTELLCGANISCVQTPTDRQPVLRNGKIATLPNADTSVGSSMLVARNILTLDQFKQSKCTRGEDGTFLNILIVPSDMSISTGETPVGTRTVKYRCEACNEEFACLKSFEHHTLTNTCQMPYKCDACEMIFTHSCELEQHIHRSHRTFNCERCGREFANLSSFEHHTLTNTRRMPYKCDACEMIFTHSCELEQHIHRSHRTFNCERCGREFANLRSFQHHTLTNTRQMPYKCYACEMIFTHSCELEQHIHRSHRTFNCERCGSEFANLSSFQHHTLTNTRQMPCKCDACEMIFTHSCELEQHVRSHRTFNCERCGSEFANLYNLKEHVRTHTGERPFSCICCGETFTRSDHLKEHMWTHGEKSFSCTMCRRKFAYPGHLKLHVRAHALKGQYEPTITT